ncbi:MAG TPA: class I SAM-dependent methyltransferase [Urbifossiella sp.]|nr:class I SAM-dependent methyltransferase [Urbifossiella sp.]
MDTLDSFADCKVLLVANANLLDDAVESGGDRELLRALAALGIPAEAIGRFTVVAAGETDPGPWLAERKWDTSTDGFPVPDDLPGAVVRADAGGVPVTLYRGRSTRPHAADDAETAAVLRLAEAALDRSHPTVVLVRPGPWRAGVLAAARNRGVAAVALQPDGSPRDPAEFRDADVVLTPSRLAAESLRGAFGLPCADLPPVAAAAGRTEPVITGAVVFDAAGAGSGLNIFAQLAEEIDRRRPGLPFVVLGGNGAVPLPSGGSVRCVPRGSGAPVLAAAAVCVAPTVGWDEAPLAAVTALAHGVPVVATDRGATRDLLGGAVPLLPLPGRITPVFSGPLRPAETGPWADAVLERLSTPSAARENDGRFTAAVLAPRYARFLAGLSARRPRPKHLRMRSTNGHANGVGHHDGPPTPVRRLAAERPWPGEQPEDAAPGQEQGWLGAGSELMLARSLTPKTKLVVELGAWLGLSTRYIADHAPAATVVSVDTWEGSPEHKTQDRFAHLLPRLFETFQARCWGYRDRVVPLRTTSLDGLRRVHAAGAAPDFIYVDAEHTYEAVKAELGLIRELFPDTRVGGDDYDWAGVRQAVDEHAAGHGLVVDRFGARGWRLLNGWEAADAAPVPPARGQWVVLVPHLNGIEHECEQALRQLESAGVRVVRRGGCSAIDVARNELASDALHDGAEALLFIDSDIGFDPADALRLFARPEPVASGVYPKKGPREMASTFLDGVREVLFGPDAVGAYPLKYAATGFLRIRAGVLRRLAADLALPLCNTHWGRGVWPFFQPLVVPQGEGKWHYLGEDWAFSHRLAQIGVVPVADTTIRLWHWGRFGFGWEDAGRTVDRYRSYSYHLAAK